MSQGNLLANHCIQANDTRSFCLSCVFTVYFGLRTTTFHASFGNSSARFINTARASIPNTKSTLSDHRSKFPVSEKSVSPRIHIPSAYGSTTSIARSPFPRGQVYPFYRPIVTHYIPGTILQVQYLLRIRKRYYQRCISPYALYSFLPYIPHRYPLSFHPHLSAPLSIYLSVLLSTPDSSPCLCPP